MDQEKLELILMHTARNVLRVSWLIAVAIVLLFSCLTIEADGAVFRIEPSIILSEEYNDNVLLRGKESERVYAYITRIAPSVRILYSTSFWNWDIDYTYLYYYYNYKRLSDGHDQTHRLNLINRTEILKDLFMVEVLDNYNRVSRDIAVDYTQQSYSLYQVDQNIFSVNPYLVLKPFLTSRIILGYMYRDTRYLNASDDSLGPFVNRKDNIGYGETALDLSSRLTFTAGVRYTLEKNTLENYNQLEAYAGPRYIYAENSFIYVRGGKSWFDFDVHPRKDYWIWDAGINHRISTVTFALTSRRFLAQDPLRAVTMQDEYTASVVNLMQRSVLTMRAGWSQYRDALFDQRVSKTQYADGTFLYRLTPTTIGTLSVGFQDVDYTTPYTGVVTRILSAFRLDHQLTEKATLSLVYYYVNSHSYDIAIYNYIDHRYMIEFRKVF